MKKACAAMSARLSNSLQPFDIPEVPPVHTPPPSLSKGGQRRRSTKSGSKLHGKSPSASGHPVRDLPELQPTPAAASTPTMEVRAAPVQAPTLAVVIEVEAKDQESPKDRPADQVAIAGKRNASEVAESRDCSECHKEGELATCHVCHKRYHQQCAGMSLMAPNTWCCLPCLYCLPTILGARGSLRTLRQPPSPRRLGPSRSSASSRSFRPHCPPYLTKFDSPEHVKNGKIQYPIDDRLLREMPELHEISILPVFVFSSCIEAGFQCGLD